MNKMIRRSVAKWLQSAALIGLFGGLSFIRCSAQTDVQYPADAGVFNVKNYGALGKGEDDTAFFQAAIKAALDAEGNNRYGGMIILYVPNGTYLISGTLQSRDTSPYSDGWLSGMYIQGQSQAGTILKLQNSCAGFTSASSPKPMIQTGSEHPLPNTAKAVTSLTSSGLVATVVCPGHGFVVGQAVYLTGETPTGYATNTSADDGTTYNYNVVTQVIDANTFTYALKTAQTSPATGTIKVASYTPGERNEAFRHYIRNLTIDVGTGNAGAVGIDFLANNRGGIYNVTIKSSDTAYAGYAGLQMDRAYPGPGIIKNLTVTGFATGISMRGQSQYGMTFDNIILSHQTSYGIDDASNTMSIEGLTSSNTVPVFNGETTTAHLALLNGTFTGGAAASTAVTGTASVYARNLKTTGYGTVIGTIAGTGSTPKLVAEYESPATVKGFAANIGGSVQLPIEETPDFNDTTLADWVNAATGTVTGGDYRASIQAAIDLGKPVVYLPQGSYAVSNTIHLHGGVEKFCGCCAILTEGTGFPAGAPLIQYDGGTVPFVDVQNLRINGTVEDNGSGDLVFENTQFSSYSNTASGLGALFLEDAGSGEVSINFPQYVWARQLNIEGLSTTFIDNKGGTVWIFGYKTENSAASGSVLVNESGGFAELLGGYFYITSGNPTVPMILNSHSSLSANFRMDSNDNGRNFAENIQDVETGTYNMTGASDAALYSGSTLVFPISTLADYTFAGSSLASSDADANSDAGSFASGTGYTQTGFGTNLREITGAGIANSPVETAAQDYAAGQYFDFTLTAHSGKLLYLSQANISTTRGQSSPGNYTLYAIPTGGPNNGQLLTVMDDVLVNGDQIGDLTGPEYQGVSAVKFFIVFDGANQGLASAHDYVGPVLVTGTAK
jgi:hypothetical protein